jgi:hypothetical protein
MYTHIPVPCFNHPPLNPLLYESSTIKGGVNNEGISYHRGKRNISTGKSEEHKNKQGKLIKKRFVYEKRNSIL